MERIKIYDRFRGGVIYEASDNARTIKEAVEEGVARGVNLAGADLKAANLEGAELSYANLAEANLSIANLKGAKLWKADLRKASLEQANLADVDLRYAHLFGAYLGGANLVRAKLNGVTLARVYLRGANFEGATGYSDSLDVLMELIRQFPVTTFSEPEWRAIGIIAVHSFSINRIPDLPLYFDNDLYPVFEKLAEKGFGEWLYLYKKKLQVQVIEVAGAVERSGVGSNVTALEE
ncbi:MAG: pentapeptide repeat-containing protein [Nitrospinota bacterium]|nr:pentapeptide repeat-containing protein [Nitrospinota bacterium]